MIAYARPGGLISLCTDIEPHGDGHPGIDDARKLLWYFYEFCEVEKVEINYVSTDVTRELAIKARKK